MRTLRGRLIASHILPVLVVTPLIGLAIYAVLLTQGTLSAVQGKLDQEATRLTNQAQTLASITGQVESIWDDPAAAQEFLANANLRLTTLTMLDTDGRILASSEEINADRIGQQLMQEGVAAILSGESTLEIQVRNMDQAAGLTDFLVPVFDVENRLSGVLLLTEEVDTAQQRMAELAWLLLIVMIVLLTLAVLLGLWLALRIESSLKRVTKTVYAIAGGERPNALPEQGIVEIDAIYRAVDTLVERLQTLEDARRRLLANLVHELGRPLGSLRAAIDALRHGAHADPELRDELLVGMNDQIGRMQPLLENLTRLHSQVLGPLELKLEPTPLSQWLPQVMTLWRTDAAGKMISWRVDIPLDLPLATIDTDQMGRALGNLFSNAVKYTPEGGTVLVEAGVNQTSSDEPNTCWIRVSDTGSGIPTSEQATIFEPFQRGQTERRFPQGMGLGLAIAQDIVVAHGGRIDLESTWGMGSRFTVTIPLSGPADKK